MARIRRFAWCAILGVLCCSSKPTLTPISAEDSRKLDEADALAERIEIRRQKPEDVKDLLPGDEDSEPARTRSEDVPRAPDLHSPRR